MFAAPPAQKTADLPAAPTPAAAAPPPAPPAPPAPTAELGEFTRMFAAPPAQKTADLPAAPTPAAAAPPPAPPAPPAPTAELGEFTRMFAAPPAQKTAAPAAPTPAAAAPPPAPPAPPAPATSQVSLRGCSSRLHSPGRRTFQPLRLPRLPLRHQSRPEEVSSPCPERRGRSRSNGRRNQTPPVNSPVCSRLQWKRNPPSPRPRRLRPPCPPKSPENSASSRPRLSRSRVPHPHPDRASSHGSFNRLRRRRPAVRLTIRSLQLPARTTRANSRSCSRRRWSRDRHHSAVGLRFLRRRRP